MSSLGWTLTVASRMFPEWEPNLQPVWELNPVTFCFAGHRPTNWATPVRAREGNLNKDTHTHRKGLCEDRGRKHPSTHQGERPQKKLTLQTPWSWISSPQNYEEIHFCLSHQDYCTLIWQLRTLKYLSSCSWKRYPAKAQHTPYTTKTWDEDHH